MAIKKFADAWAGWIEMKPSSTSLGHACPIQMRTAAQVQCWNAAREHVAARAEYVLPTPVLEPLPEALRARGDALLQRADITGPFGDWDIGVGIADLDDVLSFQKIVLTDAVERVMKIHADDQDALFSLCLPNADQTKEISGTLDNDGKGVSIASANPNLRIMGPASQP